MQNHQSPWRTKFQKLFQLCQDELKRTTEIGKKMLSASKTNSNLHNAYEELGVLVVKEMKKGALKLDHPKINLLVHQINSCEKDLETVEKEVSDIRFADHVGPGSKSSVPRTQKKRKKKSSSFSRKARGGSVSRKN